MNIKVAIRIRPFNHREEQLKTDLCIKMESQTVYTLEPNGVVNGRSYTVDHCFWSHDGYRTTPDGVLLPANSASPYADQTLVYNALGKDLLENAINGYNCCLFAYGQTGAGKSYSIFGYGPNKGLVPQICDKLFNGNYLITDAKHSFTVNISMMEIYNEKVQDLLIPVSRRPKGGLKIRENLKIGVFVEDLAKYDVSSYGEIDNTINEGNKNRTLASTLMNATSSRAHTIITLELIQKKIALMKQTQKVSVIYLVDLAGSEKVSKTGAKDDRLKEACSINKSLSVLGMVIHQLYKKSEGQKTIVSYRDAVLTRLLQNALGGNSKTTMICSISPARDNLDETISTLRYAEQAKRIKLKPTVNESETDKLIRELMEENEKLKKMLEEMKMGNIEAKQDDIKHQIREIESVIQFKKQEALPVQQHKKTSLTTGFLYKKLSLEQLKSCPHMTNLNEDPLLNGKIIYNFFESPFISIGRQTIEDENRDENSDEKKIILNGVGILEEHARLIYMDGKVTLIISEIEAACNTFVNGESMENFISNNGSGYIRNIENFDRLIIGTSTTFLFKLPEEGADFDKPKVDGRPIDWEFCQLEKLQSQEQVIQAENKNYYREREEQINNRATMLDIDFHKEKAMYEDMLKIQKNKYEHNIRELESLVTQREQESQDFRRNEQEKSTLDTMKQIELDLKNKELEHHMRINNLHKEIEQLKRLQKINENLENKLISYYPMISEANAISQTLNRNIFFAPYVASLNLLSTLNVQDANSDLIINVKVLNYENGWVNYWTLEKFENRLQLIKESLQYFFTYNSIDYNDETDPFWDPKEFFIAAQGICILKNVLYRFGMKHKIGLIDSEGITAQLAISIFPIDEDGRVINDDEEEVIKDIDQLVRKKVACNYKIKIENIHFDNETKYLDKKFYIGFEVLTDKGIEKFNTVEKMIKGTIVDINYAVNISLNDVNYEVVDYYINSRLQLKLYVDDLEVIEAKGKNLPPIIVSEKRTKKFSKIVPINSHMTNIIVPKGLTNLRATSLNLERQSMLKKTKNGDANMCVIW